MEYSSNMLAVLEAIYNLRAASGNTKLSHCQVEKTSADFTEDKKPVKRQNWYNGKSRPEWQDIKKAINGELPRSHSVERKIASFNHDCKTSAFIDRIAIMERTISKLEADLEDQRKIHEDYVKTRRQGQYEEAHFKTKFDNYKKQAENFKKENVKDHKTIQNLMLDNELRRTENEKFRKLVSTQNAVECAEKQLFCPDLTNVSDDLSEQDLLTAYDKARESMLEKMLARMAKKPPSDIFLIFYSLNTDIKQIAEGLPFKFPENNYVFACFALPSMRRHIYDTTSNILELIPPSVILIDHNSNPPDKHSNVVELPEIRQNRSAMERLRSYIGQRRATYDVIQEGYENVTVIR